jgi:hypothetical protein
VLKLENVDYGQAWQFFWFDGLEEKRDISADFCLNETAGFILFETKIKMRWVWNLEH